MKIGDRVKYLGPNGHMPLLWLKRGQEGTVVSIPVIRRLPHVMVLFDGQSIVDQVFLDEIEGAP